MVKVKKLKGKGSRIAKAYAFEDESSGMIHEQLARLKFAESLIDMKGKRILDFGCGTGYDSYYISKRQSPELVVGLDILEESIAYCKRHHSTSKTKYYVQDCLVHNPKFGLFDVVISCEVIEHVADQRLFLEVLRRYLQPDGVAFISTPNKALFSLTKEKSFINQTHVKELFFEEFRELVSNIFSVCKVYSQVHKPAWHSAYVNYLCASNLVYALRYEIFRDNILGKIASPIGKCVLYAPIFIIKPRKYLDVRNRRYTDFKFVEGYDNRAIWFVGICSNPL